MSACICRWPYDPHEDPSCPLRERPRRSWAVVVVGAVREAVRIERLEREWDRERLARR